MNEGDAAASDVGIHADLYDGVSARRRYAQVRWDDGGIRVVADEAGEEHVGWSELVRIDDLPEAIVLGRSDRDGWRLRIGCDAPAELLARFPRRRRFGRWVDRFGLGKSLACFGMVSSLAVFALVSAPSWLGARVPASLETGIGDDIVGDISANTCHTPKSDAALAALVAKLDHDGTGGHQPPIRVEVVKYAEVNAVALPGSRVLVFDGLLHNLQSPEALAGVIGHEIGHVRKRHVMQALLRQYGIAIALSGFRSGVTDTLGQMTAMRYSREAETEADDWSRARMNEAAISPIATADFFARTAEQDPWQGNRLNDYLASHPDTLTREKAFRAAWREDRLYRAALDDDQFAAIVSACRDDEKAKPWVP